VFQVPWNRHFIAFSGCRKLSLHSRRTGVIHVVTAVMTAPGDYKMTTSTAKQTETAQAIGKIVEPKATKKPRVPARGAHVASAKGKSGKKATPPKKAAKAPKTAKAALEAPKAKGTREGSKTAQIMELLKRPGGATMQEIMKATEWQPHSVRGFISGTLGKKMGLSIESTKSEDGQRTYSLKS
jgi:hypothetical protein